MTNPTSRPAKAASGNDDASGVDVRRVFVVIAIAAAFLVAVFYVMALRYYQARTASFVPGSGEVILSAKARVLKALPSFVTFAVVGGALVGAAVSWPRRASLALPLVLGTLALLGAVMGWGHVPALTIIVLASTFALTLLGVRSMTRGSRAAWAMAIALTGVLGVVTLFGAPKMRTLMGLEIWFVLLIPALCAAATTALSLTSDSYD